MSAIGSTTPVELVAFAHAALFSPAPSTLAIELKKGFDKKTLVKYPPRLYAMVKGHMDQAQKNQKSTKTATKPTNPDDDFSPAAPDARSHFCYAVLTKITGQIYSGQTGKFTFPLQQWQQLSFHLI
jgi:hypothetical protein